MRSKLVCLFVFLAATAAFAQKPSEKLKELNPFVGTYHCKGITFASDMGPEHATTATVIGTWELGGYWLDVDYREAKTAKNPMPYRCRIVMGYDEGMKKLVSGFVDNFGGYGTQASDGWDGDKFTLTGNMHMGPMAAEGRDVFTKKSATEMTHMFEMKMPNGELKKFDEETCKK